jgi:hypothetical protein
MRVEKNWLIKNNHMPQETSVEVFALVKMGFLSKKAMKTLSSLHHHLRLNSLKTKLYTHGITPRISSTILEHKSKTSLEDVGLIEMHAS